MVVFGTLTVTFKYRRRMDGWMDDAATAGPECSSPEEQPDAPKRNELLSVGSSVVANGVSFRWRLVGF